MSDSVQPPEGLPKGAAVIKTFRKKPVEIQAVQLTRENGAEVWEWADSKPFYGPDGTVTGLAIYTLEGRMKADFGDWIIRGVKGEFYPCKPDIFEASYEPAEPPVAAASEGLPASRGEVALPAGAEINSTET
jgi:hypothetical protein